MMIGLLRLRSHSVLTKFAKFQIPKYSIYPNNLASDIKLCLIKSSNFVGPIRENRSSSCQVLLLVFTSDASTGVSTGASIRALCQVRTNATQAQEKEKFRSSCVCLRLRLCFLRGGFHGEISPLMLALVLTPVLASLVKTSL